MTVDAYLTLCISVFVCGVIGGVFIRVVALVGSKQ